MRVVPCFIFILFSVATSSAQGTLPFNDYFLDQTMRIDFFQTGDADELYFSIDQIYVQGIWAGNTKKLIDNMNSGMYYVKVVDIATNNLIYSRGFATVFGEYKTTTDAKNGIKKTYHQTALIPYPKAPFLFVIEGRDEHNLLRPIYVQQIDPSDVNIIRETENPNDQVYDVIKNGHPHDRVDLVFVAEGYTVDQWEKFKKDASRFTEVIFRAEPFKSHKSRFNVSAVFRPSPEEGVDEPTKGIYKQTVVSASYNALDTPRYLLVDDTKALRDIASRVPYDHIIVIANTTRYGGGGIYNDYTGFTSDDERSENILMHEFGHGFANLADEYFGAYVAYNEFFPPGVEPHEPNITALLNPQNAKWKHLLTPGIPIPTPWGQEKMDSLRVEIQNIRKEKDARIREWEIADFADERRRQIGEDFDQKIEELNDEIEQIRNRYEKMYKGKIGVFEGAGYSPKGLYRSEVHVGMFANGEYGKVSEEAILKIIDHLSNE